MAPSLLPLLPPLADSPLPFLDSQLPFLDSQMLFLDSQMLFLDYQPQFLVVAVDDWAKGKQALRPMVQGSPGQMVETWLPHLVELHFSWYSQRFSPGSYSSC